jgi:ribosomal protein L9
LFKAIGVADIVRALGEKMGKHIPPEAVKLEKPIKEVGEHAIVLTIGDARARITIAVQAA